MNRPDAECLASSLLARSELTQATGHGPPPHRMDVMRGSPESVDTLNWLILPVRVRMLGAGRRNCALGPEFGCGGGIG